MFFSRRMVNRLKKVLFISAIEFIIINCHTNVGFAVKKYLKNFQKEPAVKNPFLTGNSVFRKLVILVANSPPSVS